MCYVTNGILEDFYGIYLIYSLYWLWEIILFIPILWLGKLRYREVKKILTEVTQLVIWVTLESTFRSMQNLDVLFLTTIQSAAPQSPLRERECVCRMERN